MTRPLEASHHEASQGWSRQPFGESMTVEVSYYLDIVDDVMLDRVCFPELGRSDASDFSAEQQELWKGAIETERALQFEDAEERGREWLAQMAADSRDARS